MRLGIGCFCVERPPKVCKLQQQSLTFRNDLTLLISLPFLLLSQAIDKPAHGCLVGTFGVVDDLIDVVIEFEIMLNEVGDSLKVLCLHCLYFQHLLHILPEFNDGDDLSLYVLELYRDVLM